MPGQTLTPAMYKFLLLHLLKLEYLLIELASGTSIDVAEKRAKGLAAREFERIKQGQTVIEDVTELTKKLREQFERDAEQVQRAKQIDEFT